jgi:hypothetical protein
MTDSKMTSTGPMLVWVLEDSPPVPLPITDRQQIIAFVDHAIAEIQKVRRIAVRQNHDCYFISQMGDIAVVGDRNGHYWMMYAEGATKSWPRWVRMKDFNDPGLGPTWTALEFEIVTPYLAALERLLAEQQATKMLAGRKTQTHAKKSENGH